jgi:hypothetical protein
MALAGALAIGSSAAFAGDYNSLVFHKETQSQDCQVSWVDFDTGNPHWYSTFNPSEANQTWRELNCGAPQVVVAGRNKTLPG